MSLLNPQQQQAVNTIKWPLLINAGAGSGKTHTITERVVSMIDDRGVDPRSIFCVTFTNKAAHEMRERIGKRLNVDLATTQAFRDHRLPIVGTFHSTAAFFLRTFIDHLGYGKDFIIYDSDDCLRVVKEIMKRQNINEKESNPRAMMGMISRAKGEGLSPDEYATTVDSYIKSLALEIYREYAHTLKQHNALDFDDLLLLFRQILDIPEVLAYFHDRFEYFMVDEYQDTNILQYEIIKILASKSRNLCVVWDDWQGIYSWRGANIENILSFKKDYPEATVINLEENYRSTKKIIDAANALIKNNSNQMQKTLFTSNADGEKIQVLEWMDEKHEAELIATTIRDADNESYSDFAVLYRTNGQSRLIEESLIRKNIPYRVFGGVKFYERKEIKDILAYIRIVFNPSDIVSLKRIINVPSRKIGAKSLEKFLDTLEREKLNIAEFAEDDFLLQSLTWIGAKWIQGFCEHYRFFREISQKESVAYLMEHIIKRTQYDAYLKTSYDENEYEWKLENLDEFLNMATRYDGMIYPENLATFLEDIALITDQDRDQDDKSSSIAGSVSLMTVHLAKWLEYPHVFVAGAEEGIFPHSRSLVDATQLEEERRLMYVAITRAKHQLYISRAYERYTYGNYAANPKSRFIKEIPEEFLQQTHRQSEKSSIFWGGKDGFSNIGGIFSTHTPASSHSQASRQQSPKNRAWDFVVWDKIQHAQYGDGTIIALRDAIADIAFAAKGVKKMNVEIAPIKKL